MVIAHSSFGFLLLVRNSLGVCTKSAASLPFSIAAPPCSASLAGIDQGFVHAWDRRACRNRYSAVSGGDRFVLDACPVRTVGSSSIVSSICCSSVKCPLPHHCAVLWRPDDSIVCAGRHRRSDESDDHSTVSGGGSDAGIEGHDVPKSR